MALASSLEELHLRQSTYLPPNLAQLTALSVLTIACQLTGPGIAASNSGILEGALPQMRRLACLVLPRVDSGLHRLPAGDWLASLRRLTAPVQVVAVSLPVLSAATALQRIGLSAEQALEPAASAQVLRWAGGRPGLQALELQMPDRSATRAMIGGLLELQRSSPHMLVEVKPDIYAEKCNISRQLIALKLPVVTVLQQIGRSRSTERVTNNG